MLRSRWWKEFYVKPLPQRPVPRRELDNSPDKAGVSADFPTASVAVDSKLLDREHNRDLPARSAQESHISLAHSTLRFQLPNDLMEV